MHFLEIMHAANQNFIEKVGLFLEADGAPRISGRILGLLLLTPGDSSLDDLADTLQVSKASVSTNARLLESWGIVDRTSRPGDRRDYYRIADDAQGRMLERRLNRMRQLRELVDEGARTVAVQDETVRSRLSRLSQFHAHCIRGLENGLEQLRSSCGPQADNDA